LRVHRGICEVGTREASPNVAAMKNASIALMLGCLLACKGSDGGSSEAGASAKAAGSGSKAGSGTDYVETVADMARAEQASRASKFATKEYDAARDKVKAACNKLDGEPAMNAMMARFDSAPPSAVDLQVAVLDCIAITYRAKNAAFNQDEPPYHARVISTIRKGFVAKDRDVVQMACAAMGETRDRTLIPGAKVAAERMYSESKRVSGQETLLYKLVYDSCMSSVNQMGG
jgi:hypothetical protein